MSNRFRAVYRELDERERSLIHSIKAYAESMENIYVDIPDARAQAIALTKLEETVMWAVKGITG